MARITEGTKKRLMAPAQYVQTTDPISRPQIVMTNLFALFFVCALLVGLFFGGKWLYERVTNSNTAENPITTISTGSSTSSSSTNSSTGSSGSSSASVTANGSGTASVSATPSSTATVTGQTANGQQTSATSAGIVPNTGTGSLLGIFVVTATIGTLGYRAFLLRKLQ